MTDTLQATTSLQQDSDQCGSTEPRTPERHLIISLHAVERFQQRVTPMTRERVGEAIAALARTAKTRTQPRHWMRGLSIHQPGTTYLYNNRFPDICLIARGGIIRTVYTRAQCRKWRRQAPTPSSTVRHKFRHDPHSLRQIQPPGWMLEPIAEPTMTPPADVTELLVLLSRPGANRAA